MLYPPGFCAIGCFSDLSAFGLRFGSEDFAQCNFAKIRAKIVQNKYPPAKPVDIFWFEMNLLAASYYTRREAVL